jgi:hypothetical protein
MGEKLMTWQDDFALLIPAVAIVVMVWIGAYYSGKK